MLRPESKPAPPEEERRKVMFYTNVVRAFAIIVAFLFLAPELAPAEPKELRVALGSFPPSLTLGISSNPSIMLNNQFTEPLVRANAEGQLVPALATSWKAIDDTTWEFKLRRGVKYHDGEPFNAQTVKFAFDRIMDPKRTYGLRSRIDPVKSVEVVDEYTMRMKTSKPFPLLPRSLTEVLMEPPPAYVNQVGEEGVVKKPVGTGPFKVLDFQPNQQLILEANPDYWDGRPKVDRLVIRNIKDPSTRVSALQAGEVHIIDQVPVHLVKTLDTAKYKVLPRKVSAGLVLTFNLLEEGPLRNLKVRQAIDYAIDRKALFNSLFQGYGAILDGQLPTKGSVGYDPLLKATPYDPEKAKKLLAEAGYGNGLSLVLNGPAGKYVNDREMILAIAAQLKKVGIDVKPNIMEFAVWADGIYKTPKPLKDFYLVGWYNLGDAELALIWYDKSSPAVLWENNEFETVFSKARVTVNSADREALLRKASEIMNRELPATPLFQLFQLYGVDKRVVGWVPRSDELIGWLYKADLH
jgi:peptide/nickel transport system substrate-binding protein